MIFLNFQKETLKNFVKRINNFKTMKLLNCKRIINFYLNIRLFFNFYK